MSDRFPQPDADARPLRPRGVVQKLARDPIRCVHLKRRDELLREDEWEWSEHSHEAFIFDSFELAEAAARLFKQQGEEHAVAVVFGAKSEIERRQQIARRANREAQAEASAAEAERIAQHQRNLERMHLA